MLRIAMIDGDRLSLAVELFGEVLPLHRFLPEADGSEAQEIGSVLHHFQLLGNGDLLILHGDDQLPALHPGGRVGGIHHIKVFGVAGGVEHDEAVDVVLAHDALDLAHGLL